MTEKHFFDTHSASVYLKFFFFVVIWKVVALYT